MSTFSLGTGDTSRWTDTPWAAQLLGGRLSLESEGLGKGAVATLELPIP